MPYRVTGMLRFDSAAFVSSAACTTWMSTRRTTNTATSAMTASITTL
ncbi:hypothetical protein [Curtobacterium sp. MCJR17_043]|nr:hypothetical protein [Curtobacterium sp. MCJR17_043]WIB34742.1 hypothetical protein DEJ15_08945 [Curtobacterium sp. MCJR17_043]